MSKRVGSGRITACVLIGRRVTGDSAPCFALTASLCSLWSLAGGAADGTTPALPAHPISCRSLPAGSSQSSAPPAPSWPAAGCQARGCRVVCAGKPSAGSASRAQPPCSGSGPRPPPSSGETPPTPAWGPGDRGDLHPGCPTSLCPAPAHPNPSAWASLGATASSPRPLYPSGSLHSANKLNKLGCCVWLCGVKVVGWRCILQLTDSVTSLPGVRLQLLWH